MSSTNLSATISVSGDFDFASYTGNSLGNEFQNIGTIQSEGNSSLNDQIMWGRAFSGLKSLSFDVAEGYKVDSINISGPSGSTDFGIYTAAPLDELLSDTFDIVWSNGVWGDLSNSPSITFSNGELSIGSGTYGVTWVVPAYGQGGPSSQAGNISLSVTSSIIPEPSTYALILGALVLGFVAYRRKL
ncbi:MAG: PEP-CTERM sorting domain-containing protein [Coraliomargaritaceae bacterium]